MKIEQVKIVTHNILGKRTFECVLNEELEYLQCVQNAEIIRIDFVPYPNGRGDILNIIAVIMYRCEM